MESAYANGVVYVLQRKFYLVAILVFAEQHANGGLVMRVLDELVNRRDVEIQLADKFRLKLFRF